MNNVVHLLTYLDSLGGMERQAIQLARKLNAPQRKVFFITCASVVTLWKQGLPLLGRVDGMRVYRIPLLPGFRYVNAIVFGFGALVLLCLLSPRYRIIHAHQLYTSGVIAAIARFLLPSKRLIVKNCCSGEFGDVKFLHALPQAQWWINIMRRSVTAFVAISEATRAEMEAVGFSPIHVIPNGVDTHIFYPISRPLRLQWRQEKGVSATECIVLFVGKLDSQKNVVLLLQSMESVTGAVRLLMIGQGSQRGELDRLIKTKHLEAKVELLGVRNDVSRWYPLVDMFVLPSRAEGSPNVLLEAMSCGLPCIGSDIEAIREVIKDRETGFLFPQGDSNALASLIQTLSNNEELRDTVGSAARASILQRFSLDAIVQKYATLYASI